MINNMKILFALILGLFFISPSVAAPLPKPPTELKTEYLYGRWEYKYGTQVGWIYLYKNGRYIAKHNSNVTGSCYIGTWWVRGKELCLWETSITTDNLDFETGELPEQITGTLYTYRFSIDKFPFVYEGKVMLASDINTPSDMDVGLKLIRRWKEK